MQVAALTRLGQHDAEQNNSHWHCLHVVVFCCNKKEHDLILGLQKLHGQRLGLVSGSRVL